MEKLETDKRLLQTKLDQPDSATPSSECIPSSSSDLSLFNRIPLTTTTRLSLPNLDHIQQLKKEVEKLKKELTQTQELHRQKMDELVKEEQDIRNENLRLQRKLQLEVRSFIDRSEYLLCFRLIVVNNSVDN